MGANDGPDEGPLLKIYKQFIHLNIKKTEKPFKI